MVVQAGEGDQQGHPVQRAQRAVAQPCEHLVQVERQEAPRLDPVPSLDVLRGRDVPNQPLTRACMGTAAQEAPRLDPVPPLDPPRWRQGCAVNTRGR